MLPPRSAGTVGLLGGGRRHDRQGERPVPICPRTVLLVRWHSIQNEGWNAGNKLPKNLQDTVFRYATRALHWMPQNPGTTLLPPGCPTSSGEACPTNCCLTWQRQGEWTIPRCSIAWCRACCGIQWRSNSSRDSPSNGCGSEGLQARTGLTLCCSRSMAVVPSCAATFDRSPSSSFLITEDSQSHLGAGKCFGFGLRSG